MNAMQDELTDDDDIVRVSFGRGVGLGLRQSLEDPHTSINSLPDLDDEFASNAHEDFSRALTQKLGKQRNTNDNGNDITRDENELQRNVEGMKREFADSVRLVTERDIELEAQDVELQLLSQHYNSLYEDVIQGKNEEREQQRALQSAIQEDIKRKDKQVIDLQLEIDAEKSKHRMSLSRVAEEYEHRLDMQQQDMRDSFERFLRRREEEHSHQMKALQARVQQAEEGISEKVSEKKMLQDTLDRVQEDYQSLSEELSRAANHVHALMDEISGLKTQQKMSNSRIGELEDLLSRAASENGSLKAEVQARTTEAKSQLKAREAADMKRDIVIRESEELAKSLRNELARAVVENRRSNDKSAEEINTIVAALNGETFNSESINNELHEIILENRAIMDQARSTIAEELEESKKEARSVIQDIVNLSQEASRLNSCIIAQHEEMEKKHAKESKESTNMASDEADDANNSTISNSRRDLDTEKSSEHRIHQSTEISNEIQKIVTSVAEKIARETVTSILYNNPLHHDDVNMYNQSRLNSACGRDDDSLSCEDAKEDLLKLLRTRYDKESISKVSSSNTPRGVPRLYDRRLSTTIIKTKKLPTKSSNSSTTLPHGRVVPCPSSPFSQKLQLLKKSIQ